MSRASRRIAITSTVVIAGFLTLGACGSSNDTADHAGKAASAKPAEKKHDDDPYLTGKHRLKANDAAFWTEPGKTEASDIAPYIDAEHQFKTDDDGFTWWQSDMDASPKLVKVSQPDHGSAKVSGKTTISYTPNAGYVGDDAFQYTVKWRGVTKTGTVIATVETQDTVDSSDSSSGGGGGGGVHACVGGKHFKMCT